MRILGSELKDIPAASNTCPLDGADDEATPLLSDAVFLLQERQHLKPKLKLSAQNENGVSTELLTIDLPTPDWKHISVEDPSDSLQVYSDMYVYL
jgi:hypothetical protein